MNKPQLGQLGGEDLGRRDAFHVPCILAICNEYLPPGVNVDFVDSKRVIPHSIHNLGSGHGISDPFIKGGIVAGTPFWVMIHPSLTDNLTHSFTVEGLDTDETSESDNPMFCDDDEEDECTMMGCS